MPEAPAGAVLPIFESGTDDAPNWLARILHEWRDAAARTAIVAVACFLFWLTWAHWGSIQIDCGREVYVPYQILRGKLLYRDLWYPYGPLEPYVSALALKLFGEHLSVLYFLGLSLAIACALVLFDLSKLVASRAVGLTVALALLLRASNFTIFNYIFPYTYSAPMGLLFSLVCLYLTLRHVLGRGGRSLMFAGLAAGLALITKQEMTDRMSLRAGQPGALRSGVAKCRDFLRSRLLQSVPVRSRSTSLQRQQCLHAADQASAGDPVGATTDRVRIEGHPIAVRRADCASSCDERNARRKAIGRRSSRVLEVCLIAGRRAPLVFEITEAGSIPRSFERPGWR